MKKKLLYTFYKQLFIPKEVQIFNNNQNYLTIQGSLGWTSLSFNISDYLLSQHSLPLQSLMLKEHINKNNLLIQNKNIENFCRYNNKTKKLCFLFPYLASFNNKLDSLMENSYFKAKTGQLETTIKNQIRGVQEAFVITLKLNGLGYKASLVFLNQEKKKRNLPRNFDFNFSEKNNIKNLDKNINKFFINQCLILDLGFSHIVSFKIPSEILLFILKPDTISIYGLDKALISQFASEIKSIKYPESFTGKGIFYSDEILQIKSGKKS